MPRGYTDEVLYIAKVHPETPAKMVSRSKLEEILKASKEVLEAAMKAQLNEAERNALIRMLPEKKNNQEHHQHTHDDNCHCGHHHHH